MLRILVLIILICLLVPPIVFGKDDEDKEKKYAQYTLQQREWFQRQISPRTKISCCNEADGEMVEEDIRDGSYWVRSEITAGLWIKIPDDIIIREPNLMGRPVVWWRFGDGRPQPYCYAPGGLI